MYLNKTHKSLFYQKLPLEGRSRCCLVLFLMDHEGPEAASALINVNELMIPGALPTPGSETQRCASHTDEPRTTLKDPIAAESPKCVQTECGSSSCYSCQASFLK